MKASHGHPHAHGDSPGYPGCQRQCCPSSLAYRSAPPAARGRSAYGSAACTTTWDELPAWTVVELHCHHQPGKEPTIYLAYVLYSRVSKMQVAELVRG